MFLSCCDYNIRVYVIEIDKLKLKTNLVNILQGHDNKVVSLSTKIESGRMWLASSSLDNYIRLWKTTSDKTSMSKHSYKLSEDTIL